MPLKERTHPQGSRLGPFEVGKRLGGASCGADLQDRRLELDRGGLPRQQVQEDITGHGGHCQCAVHPPSRVTEAPVIIDACGEQRYATSSATSSGSINRRMAAFASRICSTTASGARPCAAAWPAIWSSTSGGRTYAGVTQFEVTPWAAPSRASTLESPSSACLAVT